MTIAEFKYDVFISYNHTDETWVINTLLPNLEQSGLRVCIDFRNFSAGEVAILDIQNAIKESRQIIFVLTKNWKSGKWAQLEARLSGTLDPMGAQHKIIPLLCEKGIEKEIDEFITMRNWIDFTRDDQSLAWTQLFTALGVSTGNLSLLPEKTSQQLSDKKEHIPRRLPRRNEFIGRKEEKKECHKALLSRSYIISIEGIGGVGKTSLALEVAYECLFASENNSSDEIAKYKSFVWVGTKDQGVTLDNILDEIAQTLEYTFFMKQHLDEKRKTIIKLLKDNPCLLIIDGFENIKDDNVRIFLRDSLPEPSKVLLTTRVQTIESRSIPLRGLPDIDAIELIRSHSQELQLIAINNADSKILLRLCKATGGLPLAIKWALGQIKQKGQSLDAVLEFLYNAKGDVFDQIFSRSWNLLSEESQRILYSMTVFADSTFQEAISAASGVPFGFEFDEAIGQLVEMSLVDTADILELSQKRYSLHPLTRVYANRKLEFEYQTTHEIKERLATFFEAYTREHGGLWNLEGSQRLALDISNIIPIIKWCWQEKIIEIGVNIFDNIRYFMVNYGLWDTALEVAKDAIGLFPLNLNKPSKRLAKWQVKLAVFRIWPIAWIYRFREKYELSKNEINNSLEIFKRINDTDNISMAKRHLGLVYLKAGEFDKSEIYLRESFEYEKNKQDVYRIHLLTADLADLALQKNDLDTAQELSKLVLDDLHPIEDRQCIARFYRVLGSIARQQGDLHNAKTLCTKSLHFTEGLKYLDGIADASFELAQIEVEMGQKEAAHQNYQHAHELYKALGMELRAQEIEKIFLRIQERAHG